MSNNYITKDDFEKICRTCLSRDDLKPLYGKCTLSICPADMLKSCTSIMFKENDGFPVNICKNCIYEINQAYSFAKRCETTDTILRDCVVIKTEPENVKVIIEEIKQEDVTTEMVPEVILPNVHQAVEKVAEDYEFVAVKQEEERIKNDCDETNDDPTYKSNDEDQDETNSDNPESLRIENDFTPTKKLDLLRIRHRREKTVPAKLVSKEFQCTKCDRAFAGNRGLQQHYEIHEKNKFFCSDCGRGFVCKDLLNSHSKIHTTARPYACPMCGKAFRHVGHLNVHKLIHTGEKPHACSICSKAFIEFISLKEHMRIHTGEKPYTCTVCSKAFAFRTSFNRHMRMHAGEKPYSCGVCSKAFTENRNLKYHMSVHTGEKPYPCGLCSKAFTKPNNLKCHFSRFHTGEK